MRWFDYYGVGGLVQTYHREREEIKDIFITGFTIYDLSLKADVAGRQNPGMWLFRATTARNVANVLPSAL